MCPCCGLVPHVVPHATLLPFRTARPDCQLCCPNHTLQPFTGLNSVKNFVQPCQLLLTIYGRQLSLFPVGAARLRGLFERAGQAEDTCSWPIPVRPQSRPGWLYLRSACCDVLESPTQSVSTSATQQLLRRYARATGRGASTPHRLYHYMW